MNILPFKNSFRFLLKNRNYLLINMLGLGIGITSFIVLSLYVYNDLTYNHFNKNISNIYRVYEGESIRTKGLLLPKILEEIPEVENGTRKFDGAWFRISYGEKAFLENIHYADTGFFSVFSFPFVEGSAKRSIHEKYGVVVSTDFAKKYFGEDQAIGKKLKVKFDDTFFEVNGVVDIPVNSSVKFDIVASYETGEILSPWIKDVHDWYNTFSKTHVLLKHGIKPEQLSDKLQRIVTENFIPAGKNETELKLLPLKKYHGAHGSNRSLIIILGVIAFGIVCVAIVNFINLTITSSLSRAKEIGIKKVIGASRNHLFRQIMTESLVVSFLALFFGCVLAYLLLPKFNQLFDMQLQFSLFGNKIITLVLILIWLIVGALSGLLPSLFWMRAKLTQSLHGNLFSGKKIGTSRYSLVIVQFVIAIFLISGTFMVRKQINGMLGKDPKFDQENVIAAELESWQYPDQEEASQKFRLIAEELEKSPYVHSVCFSESVPGTYHEHYNTFYPDGGSKVDEIYLRKSYVGRNYFETYGVSTLSGSAYNQDLISYKGTVILNKAAMMKLGFDEATGQIIREGRKNGYARKIIGMVDDFSYQGAHKEMQPLIHFFISKNIADWNYLSVRAKPGASLQVIQLMKEKWKAIGPESTVNYFFVSDKLNEHYKEYIRINKVVSWFSAIAIILSCVGLFALSSYSITQKIKEIGIRKVNGAKVSELLAMLNKDFVKWVAIAFIIACPIAYYAMKKWLENFAYKTTLSWWIFVLAGAIALGIALLTVSWQSYRAASRNPVEALRYE